MTYSFASKPIPAEKPPVQHVERPWGAFEQYAFNQEVTVSLMTVKPGQRLSLQAHTGRAELWIALDDGAEVRLGPGDCVIQNGTRHAWRNRSSQPVVIFVAIVGARRSPG